MIDIKKLIERCNFHIIHPNLPEECYKECLIARIEMRNCYECDDGWKPDYDERCKPIEEKYELNASVIGDLLYDEYMEMLIEELKHNKEM